jgi:hypothetical protein
MSSTAIITAGTDTISVPGNTPLSTSSVFKRSNSISVNGNLVFNGSIITIGGTQVTISIPPGCEGYI